MINLNLSSAELKIYNSTCYSSHAVKTIVQVLDLNHKYVADLSDIIEDGQVNYDIAGKPTRNLTFTVIDPDRSLGFDSNSPGDGSLYADRMIRVVHSKYVAAFGKWVDCPVFCGPITNLSRDEAILSLECQGKESRWINAVYWKSRTFKKGSQVDDVIKAVMTDMGETKFDIPNITNKIAKDLSLTDESNAWDFVQSIVPSGYQLFYDGRGVLRLREKTTASIFTFTELSLISIPKVSYDGASIKNTVKVKGATKGKKQIVSKRTAPASAIGSAMGLGSNGKPNTRVVIIEDDKIDTQKEADARATKELAKILLDNVTVEFESFVIPHLEPGDVYTLQTRNYSVNQSITQMSIPLKAGSGGSMGATKRYARNKKRIRG